MRIFISIFLIFLVLSGSAQVNDTYVATDIIAVNAPDSAQSSVDRLGRYFANSFRDKKLRARAIFTFTATKISYNSSLADSNQISGYEELATQTIVSREAICLGYSALFKALCDRCDIEAYLVNGYIGLDGKTGRLNHSWVIALIDSAWFGFDPACGGGYAENQNFAPHFSDRFFMISPGDLIKDHMPFDPLWECLNYPVSHIDFASKRTTPFEKGPYFSYPDSIKTYQALNQAAQCRSALRRIENAGVTNNLILAWMNNLQKCARMTSRPEDFTEEKSVNQKNFEDAANAYNRSVYLFNQYADYWNREFTPPKPELEILAMLDSSYYYLDSCKKILNMVKADDEDMKQSMDQLKVAEDVARESLDRQKVFVKVYFNTDPPYRKNLFKQYGGIGLPK